MPQALSIGISYNEFWHMNPHIVMLILEGYNEKRKREVEEKNWLAHLQGQYFLEAMMVIASSFGKGKRHEYPSKPYEFKSGGSEISEEEKRKQAEFLFASLDAMASNFKLTHGEKNNEEKEIDEQSNG